MRIARVFLAMLIACHAVGIANAQLADGECTVPLDISSYEGLADEIFLLDDIEFGIAAPLMETAPTTDGVLTPNEYANTCFFAFDDHENPGQPWPGLDNLQDGDADLTAFMHFGHTADYLFVAFEVFDDFLDLDFPANSFQNDGVELFFNPDIDTGDPWGPGRFQVYVDAAGDGDIELNNRGSTAGITHAFDDDPIEGEVYTAGLVLDDESGYVVEYKFPLSSLDKSGGDEDLEPMQTGDFLLMNAAIDDNDDGDNLGGQTGHHVLWHNDGAGSPFGGGEPIWNVPLELTGPVVGGEPCDVDGSGVCDAADIDALAAAIRGGETNSKFDLNGDGSVNGSDREHLINVEFNSYIGDSNLDGEFGSADFVQVFIPALYETGQDAGWAEGDWNGDGKFDSSDFVAAFIPGAYEKGPRGGAAAVPEPSAIVLISMAIGGLALARRRK